jgi:hypothetical protein
MGWLDELTGTKTASQEKLAEDEMVHRFNAAARASNVDVTKLSNDQLAAEWNHFFYGNAGAKVAADEEKKDGLEAIKKDKKEDEEKEREKAKHAYAREMGNLVAVYAKEAMDKMAAEGPPPGTSGGPLPLKDRIGKHLTGKNLAVGGGAAALTTAGIIGASHYMKKKRERKEEEAKAKNESPPAETEASKKEEEKTASDIAFLNAEAAALAVKLASEQLGADPGEAQIRITAMLYTDGVPDYSKTASAQTEDQAVAIRALELLEAAKYPVNWG